MIYFVTAWLFLSIACWLIGIFSLNQLQANCFARVSDRLLAALWLGVVILPIILLTIALIVPLSLPIAGVIIGSLGVMAYFSQQTRFEIAILRSILSPNLILALGTLAAITAALTTHKVTWIDTGLYHYQAIQWLSKFGTVPGLTLLSEQLGFSSSWFALAAPFNLESFSGRASAITNGFILFVVLSHLLISSCQIFSNKALVSDWFITIFFGMTLLPLVGTNLLSTVLVSPSPDIPVIFLTGVIGWSILVITNRPIVGTQRVLCYAFNPEIIPLILSTGTLSIKLTALPLLAISLLFYVFYRKVDIRRLFVGVSTIFLLLLSTLANGIITSGCPLYPSAFLCIDLPWSQSIQEVNRISEITRGWGTWFGSAPAGVYAPWWLFLQWFNSIQSSKIIVGLILLSLLSVIYVLWMSKLHQYYGYIWLLLLAIAGTIFMMLKAPLLRFGLGYVVILPALSLAIFLQAKIFNGFIRSLNHSKVIRQLEKFNVLISISLMALLTVALLNPANQSRFLLPPPLPTVELQQKKINDVVYWTPLESKSGCWAASLPCASQPEDDIKLRSSTEGFSSGFIRKP
jgi:hypothetical protein